MAEQRAVAVEQFVVDRPAVDAAIQWTDGGFGPP